ncbi:aminopeptidase C [Algivirga pacifica]|uniref:Aminopeptidase n=1 Tax=Algivirga pacifica TaxID=1162670 RepID=A0ABP9DLH3_9BACT
MNYTTIKSLLASVALAGVAAFNPSYAQDIPLKDGYQLQELKKVKVTPVKSQGRTGTCWSFSTTSFIESEAMRMGKGELDLSEMYFVRHNYPVKAEKYVRYHGKSNFGEGSLSHDVTNIIKTHGIVPENVYTGLAKGEVVHDHGELFNVLESMLGTLIKSRKITPKWKDAFNAVLDSYLGEVPETFEVKGKTFTPQEYAEKVVGFNPEDYVEITSFNHHPYYEQVQVEVPDNWAGARYYNLPLDEFEQVMDYALDRGYSLVWDGDVSEKSFSHKNGIAIVPAKSWEQKSRKEREGMFEQYEPELQVDESYRQTQFDNYTTTDDHLMHIIGTVNDEKGGKYYVTKNSWGSESNAYGGYLYMSRSFVRLKSVAFMVHKDAVPNELRKKLGII